MNDGNNENEGGRETNEGAPYQQYGKDCGTKSVMVFAKEAEHVGQFAQPQELAAKTKDVCAKLGIQTRPMMFTDGSAAVNTVIVSRPMLENTGYPRLDGERHQVTYRAAAKETRGRAHNQMCACSMFGLRPCLRLRLDL